MSVHEAHRGADISLYRTSISHLGVDFSFFSAQLESISPFALCLSAVIEYRGDVYERLTRITIPRCRSVKRSVPDEQPSNDYRRWNLHDFLTAESLNREKRKKLKSTRFGNIEIWKFKNMEIPRYGISKTCLLYSMYCIEWNTNIIHFW